MGGFLKEAASETSLGGLSSLFGLMEMGLGDCPLEHRSWWPRLCGGQGSSTSCFKELCSQTLDNLHAFPQLRNVTCDTAGTWWWWGAVSQEELKSQGSPSESFLMG